MTRRFLNIENHYEYLFHSAPLSVRCVVEELADSVPRKQDFVNPVTNLDNHVKNGQIQAVGAYGLYFIRQRQ